MSYVGLLLRLYDNALMIPRHEVQSSMQLMCSIAAAVGAMSKSK